MNAEFSTELLTIARTCLGVGLVIGFLLTRAFSSPARQKRHLTQELQQNQQTSVAYQQDVIESFVKTSELTKNLTACYAELHQHLADSAAKLANPETGRQLAEAGSVQLELVLPETTGMGQPQAPKDYAPGNGVLSEGYGFAATSSIDDAISEDDTNQDKPDPLLKAG